MDSRDCGECDQMLTPWSWLPAISFQTASAQQQVVEEGQWKEKKMRALAADATSYVHCMPPLFSVIISIVFEYTSLPRRYNKSSSALRKVVAPPQTGQDPRHY